MAKRDPVANGVLIALCILALLLVIWMVWRLAAVVVLILIAGVLSAGIAPLAKRISEFKLPIRDWKIPEGLAILVVILGAILVFLGLMTYVGSVLWSEGTQLIQDLPELTENIRESVEDLREEYPQIPPLDDMIPEAQEQIGQVAGYAVAATTAIFGVLGGLVTFITVVVLTFYFTAMRRSILESFLAIIPPAHEERVRETCLEATARMGGWLRGQLLLAGISTFVISVVMVLVGMPYPLLIGLIGGIAELIPLLGPIVAGIVAIPIALLTQPGWVAIIVIIFFVLFSQLESNVLTPKIMASQVGLSPALTILALLAGGTLLGIVGALIAVPIAAALRVVFLRHALPEIQEAEGKNDAKKEDRRDGPSDVKDQKETKEQSDAEEK